MRHRTPRVLAAAAWKAGDVPPALIEPPGAEAQGHFGYWELYSRAERNAFLSVLFLVGASNYLDWALGRSARAL